MKAHRTNNEKQTGIIALILLGLFVVFPTAVDAFTFSRDLKLGDSGEDVRALQVSLNADPQTRVAASGVGSPGYETTFFGEKTQSAVIRYQNLHSSDVLKPLGLTVGTGYVGAATRNSLGGVANVSAGETIGKTSLSDALSAFDAAIGGSSKSETNRSPVDDPRIPNTQEELVVAVDDFAGSDATEEEIQDFSRQMVLARYGYATNLQRAPGDDDDDNDDDDTTTPRSQCSDGVNNDPSEDNLIDYPNDSGCINAEDNTESRSTHRTPGSQDGDIDGTGAGCIALLFNLLGF